MAIRCPIRAQRKQASGSFNFLRRPFTDTGIEDSLGVCGPLQKLHTVALAIKPDAKGTGDFPCFEHEILNIFSHLVVQHSLEIPFPSPRILTVSRILIHSYPIQLSLGPLQYPVFWKF